MEDDTSGPCVKAEVRQRDPLMQLVGKTSYRCCLLLLCALPGGCAILPSGQTGPADSRTAQSASSPLPAAPSGNPQSPLLRRVSFTLRPADPVPGASSLPDSPLAETPALTVDALV